MSTRETKQTKTDFEKEFIENFQTLCCTRSALSVWTDFITVCACSIANSVDRTSAEAFEREKEYEECISRLGNKETVAAMLSHIVLALAENLRQDFLGSIFMKLGLGNHWKGQFFTPYHICEMMAEINLHDANKIVAEQGFISINDCCCGAGAMLIGAANALYKNGINFQRNALFVAQDVDRVAGMMCYIQLALLGCPGYVVVANSLTHPITGNALFPDRKDGQEFWFTPNYKIQAGKAHYANGG